jgi:hypothetical protein
MKRSRINRVTFAPFCAFPVPGLRRAATASATPTGVSCQYWSWTLTPETRNLRSYFTSSMSLSSKLLSNNAGSGP